MWIHIFSTWRQCELDLILDVLVKLGALLGRGNLLARAAKMFLGAERQRCRLLRLFSLFLLLFSLLLLQLLNLAWSQLLLLVFVVVDLLLPALNLNILLSVVRMCLVSFLGT